MTAGKPMSSQAQENMRAAQQRRRLRERPEHWSVTVSRSGEEIVTIESNCLSGRDITPEDEKTIRTASAHLLSFIGAPGPRFTTGITRLELEKAVTAASNHIAPCGHNELGNIFDAVIDAFRSIGLGFENEG